MKKKRRTYWIVDQVRQVHRDRALLLSQKGYEVQFFSSVDFLIRELQNRRAAIIIVSDEGSPEFVDHAIIELMAMPEIQGARLILTTSRNREAAKRFASIASFRDLLPMDLSERQWLQRFIFATANRSLPFIQPPGQVTLNNISAVSMPARITWISSERLRIECRVKPPIGAMLKLRGKLAESMGVNALTLTVVENQRSHLIYRFSEAMVCEWKVPAASKAEALEVFKTLKEESPNQRCRVFIGAQKSSLRNELLTAFDDPRFEVSAALQFFSLVNEPKFFTPHAIIIEAALLNDDKGQRFREMMKNIPDGAMLLIIGTDVDHAKIRRDYPGNKIVVVSKIPHGIGKTVLERYAPLRNEHHADEQAVFVTGENPYSMAEINFSARLTKVHPIAVQVSLPFPVGNFALCQVESPLLRKTLGRSPYMKFTSTYQDLKPNSEPYVYLADGYLADLSNAERSRVGEALTKIVSEQLQKFELPGQRFAVASVPTRTPELGSTRAKPTPQIKQTAYADAKTSAAPSNTQSKPVSVDQFEPLVPAAHVKPPLVASSGNTAPKLEEDSMRITMDDFTDLLKPAVMPVAEKVEDFKRGMRETAGDDTFKLLVKYVALTAFMIAALWGLFVVMSTSYEKSGRSYTDSLKKFAPLHFKKFDKDDKKPSDGSE
jgi:hypothetical protein